MTDEQAPPKKPVRRQKASKTEESASGVEPTTWFGHKQKIQGRPNIFSNNDTNEVDILSISYHSGIMTDEDLTSFLMDERTLKTLDLANKSISARSKTPLKAAVITRYYSSDSSLPEHQDPRILYTPSPPEMSSRWAIVGPLVPTICTILDNPHAREHQTARESPFGPSAIMVTFRSQRRDITSISSEELEIAEVEVMTTHSISMMRDLINIKRVMIHNMDKTMLGLFSKLEAADAGVEGYKKRIENHGDELSRIKREYSQEISSIKAENEERRLVIRHRTNVMSTIISEEYASRLSDMNEYYDEMLGSARCLAQANARTKIGTRERPVPLSSAIPDKPVDETIASLTVQLEDAKLEINRLKDEVRAKAVPKPKVHSKFKDPDIQLATEADIKRSVKAHLSEHMMSRGGSLLGTPISSTCSKPKKKTATFSLPLGSTLSTAGVIDLRIMEEKEVEAARNLKSISRLREQDLGNAELASEQLIEVVEALSSMLTRVSLTIEDVAMRRTSILNHMRSLSVHSRSIASMIRERPYLLSLARRMNRERRPMVNLTPLRALINVTVDNFKSLQHIESITLDSVGGAFEVISLDEAAEAGLQSIKEEESWSGVIPETVISISSDPQAASTSPGRVLTRATLRRHTMDISRPPSPSPVEEDDKGSATE